LKLAEFEFDIEYRPGKYIQHEDALSRLIAAVSRDPPESKEYTATASERFFLS